MASISIDGGGATGGRFATTQWSVVLAAAKRGSADAEEALARLCGPANGRASAAAKS
jgi:hypothetical protein